MNYNIRRYLILLLFLPMLSFGQKQGNIWYFGDHAGLDFNGGIPVAITDGATSLSNFHSEGTSAISDSSGSLLFYTNGEKVWNRNHQVMLNGDSLLGNYSATQSSIIVPKPGSDHLFYVFTVDDYYNGQLQNGFRYSVVDICFDEGLGGIVSNEKNVLLVDTVAEKAAVVRHSNGIDYWILTHKLYSGAFYAFLLTSDGIVDTVISDAGPQNLPAFQGQLKVSPNGNRIGMASTPSLTPSLDLFDFDKATGIVSNRITLNRLNPRVYGLEFSLDNTKLYVTYSASSPVSLGVDQYDLNAGGGNIDAINNSLNTLFFTGGGTLRALQLGPDGKIYMVGFPDAHYISVINNPNNNFPQCNFQDSAIYLAGTSGNQGLPTFISNFDYSNTIASCQCSVDVIHNGNLLTASQNETYQWYLNGDSIPGASEQNLTILVSGSYYVTATDSNGCQSQSDTLELTLASIEQDKLNAIQIYPNPFKSSFTIRFTQPTKATVTIFNLNGQKIISQDISVTPTIDLKDQSPGVYFVEVKTYNKVYWEKVVME